MSEGIYNLLSRTARRDEMAMRMLESTAENSVLKRISEITEGFSAEDPAGQLELIAEGMSQYVTAYKAPPSVCQKHWDACKAWLDRIAAALNTKCVRFEDYATRPIVEDTKIALIKALHSNAPKTKMELQYELTVSDKTIQNDLRALCPALQQTGKKPEPLRIGGQELRAEIREETVERRIGNRIGQYKAYRMPDRLHPLILQMNTMQTAHLLTALQKQNYTEGDIVSYEIALDIWCQLSPEGKQRIREVYCSRDRDFADFIEDLDSECRDGRIPEFHTEGSLQSTLDNRGLLESVFKSGIRVSLTIRRDENRIRLRNVRVRWGEHGGDDWLAIPEKEWPKDANGFRFRTEEIQGGIELH